jgi:hypothetical protein
MYTNKPIDEFQTAPESFVPGRYLMRIKSSTIETAKDTRQFHKVVNEVLEGPTATKANGEPVDYVGREFTDVIFPPDPNVQSEDWQIEQAERTLRSFLEGYQIPWEEEGSGSTYDTDDFPGAEAWVTLGPQKRNPEMMEVKKYEEV